MCCVSTFFNVGDSGGIVNDCHRKRLRPAVAKKHLRGRSHCKRLRDAVANTASAGTQMPTMSGFFYI